MITQEQYDKAILDKTKAEEIIGQFHKEKTERFNQRLVSGVTFTDDELIYAAHRLCPCGHGLAYPKDCGIQHYWDCSAILRGIADLQVVHTGKLPFMYYEIKSELQPSAKGCTTRGVFLPKKES